MRKRQRKKNLKKAKWRHFCVFITQNTKPDLYIDGIQKDSKLIGLHNNVDVMNLCKRLNIPIHSETTQDKMLEWVEKYLPVWHVKDWPALNEVRPIKKQKFYLVGDEWPRKCQRIREDHETR